IRRINFETIEVDDQDRARDFYRDVIGMTVHTDAVLDNGTKWIFMEVAGCPTLLQLHKAEGGEIPDLALVCDNVDEEIIDLKKRGATVVTEPTGAFWNPNVRFAMLTDTENNTILLQSSSAEGG
ncbi:MAG: VOC family protein, partial [Pseudomonadota bacterium]